MAFFAHLLAFLGVGFCMLARKHFFDVYMGDKGDGGGRSTVYSVVQNRLHNCVHLFYFSVWM